MTDTELKEKAKERFKNGKFTKPALEAQRVIWENFHWHSNKKSSYDNGYVDLNIEDIQYNGM